MDNNDYKIEILERYFNITDETSLVFSPLQNILEDISKSLDNNQNLDDCKKILNLFTKNANHIIIRHSDLRPLSSEIFTKAISHKDLSTDEIHCYIRAMFHKNNLFMLKASPELISKNHDLARFVYENMGNIENYSPNDENVYCNALKAVCKNSDKNFIEELLHRIYDNPDQQKLQEKFAPYLSELYKDAGNSELRPFIFSLMKKIDPSTPSFFSNLKEALLCGHNPQEILQCIDQTIDKTQNASGLSIAYSILGKDLREKAPNLRSAADNIISRATKNPNNNRTSLQQANLYLERWSELRGKAMIGQRVERSEKYPFAWKKTNSVSISKPCLLCLGGSGTLTEEEANGYAKDARGLLRQHKMEDKVDIYAAAYDFGYNSGEYMLGSRDTISRAQMFKDYKRLKELKRGQNPTEEDKNPKYIKDLFDVFILPRISKDGERLSKDEAMQNMRNIQIFAHCHGAYTAMKMEEMALDTMKKLGYSKQECLDIQKELLVIAQSPACPLGVSKSTFISFASAKDAEVSHHNHFHDTLWEMNQEHDIRLSYFDEKKGNLFVVPTTGVGEYAPDQHNFWGLKVRENRDREFTVLHKFETNAIINGLKSAMEGSHLPSIKELVCGSDGSAEEIFEKTKANGEELYSEIAKRSKDQARATKYVNKHRDSRDL